MSRRQKTESEYWAERFRLVEEDKQKSLDYYSGRIYTRFNNAENLLDERLEKFYTQYGDLEGIDPSEARKRMSDPEKSDLVMTLQEYIDKGRLNASKFNPTVAEELEKASLNYRITRLEGLKLELKAQMAALYEGTNKDVTSALNNVYTEQYNRTAFELFKGTGILDTSFVGLSKEEIDLAIRTPWRDNVTFSTRLWLDQQLLIRELGQEMANNILTGEAYDTTAKRLKDRLGDTGHGAMFRAKRLVYTEGAFFSGLAQNKCKEELGVEYYEFRSELNTHVCDVCADLDGKHFKMSERQVGKNAVPMHPFCRCIELPYFPEDDFEEFRTGRDENGKSVLFPEDMTYQKWKKEILDNINKNADRSYIRYNRNINVNNAFTAEDVFQNSLSDIAPKVVSLIPQVFHDKFGETHCENIETLIDDAPEDVKGIWSLCQDNFNLLERKPSDGLTDAYFNPVSGGVVVNIEFDSQDKIYSNAYESVFHEFGHSMDHILNGERGQNFPYSAYSEEYNNGEFIKALNDDTDRYLDNILKEYVKNNRFDFFGGTIEENIKNLDRYLPDDYPDKEKLKRKLKTWDIVSYDLVQIPEVLEGIKKEYNQDNSLLFKAFKKEKKNKKYENRKKYFNVSDVLEAQFYRLFSETPYINETEILAPLGGGHRYRRDNYWLAYNYRLGTEAFAEMTSAFVCNPESIEAFQEMFPTALEVYKRMIKEALNDERRGKSNK